MRYVSQADIEAAIPPDTLRQLSSDDPHAAGPDWTVVEQAVAYAEELIDAHLRGRYALPLATVPTVLRNLTIDLTRCWLYGRRPEGMDFPEAVRRGCDNAMKLLKSLADGTISLGLPTGESTPTVGSPSFLAPGRVMDEGAL
ncbi:MAG TPA: DUF1320 domain-containing protein [bacterium]|nr:DUF1320 domain-containing protein [bacterium]